MIFESIRAELTPLLQEFGPHRATHHPEHAFWRLRRDGVWEIDQPRLVEQNLTASGDAKSSILIRHNVRGGFPEPIHKLLRTRPEIALCVAQTLLPESHFPRNLHAEILQSAGISQFLRESEAVAVREILPDYSTTPEFEIGRRLKREQNFRHAVLRAYQNQCAVCRFAIKLKGFPIGLEAAHIQWHVYKGPAQPGNGLALCALHQELFDLGAFPLIPKEFKIIVAEELSTDDCGFNEALGNFHEKSFGFVSGDSHERPAPKFIAWHQRQVFRSPRQLSG